MRFSIKAKLAVTFGAVLLISAVVGLLAIRDMATLNTAITNLIDGPTERAQLGLQLETAFGHLARAEKDLILSDNDQMMDRYDADILATRKELSALEDRLRSISDDVGKQHINAFGQSLSAYISVQDKLRELARRDTETKSKVLSQTVVPRSL